MYAYLCGVVASVQSDRIVMELGGMGYELFVSQTASFHIGEERKVFTYLHVREDDLSLFGFSTLFEKDVFLKLITVKGVGPKTGLNVMSKTTPELLIQAIEQEDVKYLRTLPGVGPKMASQIILDLKGKLTTESDVVVPLVGSSLIDDVNETLASLGFKSKEIQAIQKSLKDEKFDTIEVALQFALRIIKR